MKKTNLKAVSQKKTKPSVKSPAKKAVKTAKVTPKKNAVKADNKPKKLKYYERVVTKREAINRFGKLGYVPYKEMIKTHDIQPYNKGKRILFTETKDKSYLLHKKPNVIYSEQETQKR